jgi:Uma2 family endonuclease
MHATIDPMLPPDDLQPERIRLLSRREYDQLVALGVFEDERIELLRGMLVTMSLQGDVHAGLTAWLAQRFTRATDESIDVRSHSPFAADDYSEPEPDVVVARRRATYAHPEPAEVLLLIEVSDSSLRKDRKIKVEIYAEAGVPEYWIFDVRAKAIDVHTQPVEGRYTSVVRMKDAGVLRPVALPGVSIDVADIRWD